MKLIHLNLLNTRSETCRQFLRPFFYNIIGQKTEAGFLDFLYSLLNLKFDRWYYLYLGEHSDQGNILLWHLGADCNRWLWNYKITQFTVFVQCGWGVDVNFWMFAARAACEQNQTSVNKGGGGVQILVILW